MKVGRSSDGKRLCYGAGVFGTLGVRQRFLPRMPVVVEATLYVSFQLDLLSPSEGSASGRPGLIADLIAGHYYGSGFLVVHGGAKHKNDGV